MAIPKPEWTNRLPAMQVSETIVVQSTLLIRSVRLHARNYGKASGKRFSVFTNKSGDGYLITRKG